MGFITKQNSPIEINLIDKVNESGWTIDNGKLIHESCNNGTITVNEIYRDNIDYAIVVNIESLSSGSLVVSLGNDSITFTSVGYKRFVLKSIGVTSPKLSLYSTGAMVVSKITTKAILNEDIANLTDSLTYNALIKKWVSFNNCYPDNGFSLFGTQYTFKDGLLYSHTDTVNRNKFYGTSYESKIKVPFSSGGSKTFKSIDIHSNKLLITTPNGIKTSLGQVSNLVKRDFERYILSDNITSVNIYSENGVYRANFQRALPDISFGERLRGDYLTMEITTKDDKNFILYKLVVDFIQNTPQ